MALTKAVINRDLTQNLSAVYANPDPRTYPLSSYSYMIIPTTTATPFNADKGRSLATFINYFLCGGQQKAQNLGYSPLPKNLVMAGFDQVKAIPGTVRSPSINSCNNPALSILNSAPMPQACAKKGSLPCDGFGGIEGKPVTASGTSAAGSANRAAAGGTGATAGQTGGAVDPTTGPPLTDATANEGVPLATAAGLQSQTQTWVLYAIAALALIGVVVVPPIIIARRDRSGS